MLSDNESNYKETPVDWAYVHMHFYVIRLCHDIKPSDMKVAAIKMIKSMVKLNLTDYEA